MEAARPEFADIALQVPLKVRREVQPAAVKFLPARAPGNVGTYIQPATFFGQSVAYSQAHIGISLLMICCIVADGGL